ncbi:hypothetical protein SDC9_129563 [bioreactor metagenome]|uniref:Uncharacterized protein n=1 Tax=bioreactor metagenome TaxID=1076179 RepID=A0A645D139_9ZZZZ
MLEITILLVAALITGYYIGKRMGHTEGFAQGKAETALIMRQESFEHGYCVLCKGGNTLGMEDGGITTDPSTHTTYRGW